MTIGKLAKQSGVGVETIRYYERRGLIERPQERRGAFRVYTPETVSRIRSIKRAQSLGFSLKEIKELMALRLEEGAMCGDVLLQTEKNRRDRREAQLASRRETPTLPPRINLPRGGPRRRVPDSRSVRGKKLTLPVRCAGKILPPLLLEEYRRVFL